jgi:hypothetical protein
MDATLDGPKDKTQCSTSNNETWYYVGEPACQCNGHSTCSTEQQRKILVVYESNK